MLVVDAISNTYETVQHLNPVIEYVQQCLQLMRRDSPNAAPEKALLKAARMLVDIGYEIKPKQLRQVKKFEILYDILGRVTKENIYSVEFPEL